MRQDINKVADELDFVAEEIKYYAKILRGEVQDLTGCGAWMILCSHLEHAMDCVVITRAQYESFVDAVRRSR